jgi:hypothetical protein
MVTFPFIGPRLGYGRAIRKAADDLVAAHGELADLEAWRAALLPGLPAAEQAFCQAVAERVTRLLGKAPTAVRR